MSFNKKISKFKLKLLINKKYSVIKIANLLSVNKVSVYRWLKEYKLSTSAKQSIINRNKSIVEGRIYYNGQICKKDLTHGNKRFVSSYGCVKCASINQYEKKSKTRIAQGKIPSKEKNNITKKQAYSNLLIALKNGETLYQGITCDYGHQGIRRVETYHKTKSGRYIQGKCEDCARSTNYFRKYGITIETYNEMLKKQNFKCKFCNNSDSGRETDRNLIVEHNHKNGNVRGLVCHKCNSIIEKIENNFDKIYKFKRYITSDNDYRKIDINKKTLKILKSKNKRNRSHSRDNKGNHPSLYSIIK